MRLAIFTEAESEKMQIREMVAANYIAKNIDVFKSMVKIGAVPASYLNYYNIYCVYSTTAGMKCKMDRYYFTSDATKTSVNTVREAVRVMETRI